MKQEEFDLLDDESMIWFCVEPILKKTGKKDAAARTSALSELNDAQRSLFLFQLLYGYAGHGLKELYSQIEYLAEIADIWSGIKTGMQYFGDLDMLAVVSAMEKGFYEARNDPGNFVFLEALDRLYKETVPASVSLIAAYIRNNPEEFLLVGSDAEEEQK